MNLQETYQNNIELLKKRNINFKEFDHEPVFDYEAIEVIRKKFNLTGVESKNLFLKTKDNRYYVFVTTQNKRADFNKLKELLGTKVSLASKEDLKEQTGCEPGCAVPFGFNEDIIIIVDKEVFNHEKFVYSPGPPEKSIEITTKDLKIIFDNLKNKVIFL